MSALGGFLYFDRVLWTFTKDEVRGTSTDSQNDRDDWSVRRRNPLGDDIGAHMMAEKFVKAQLKAPGTAKWPWSVHSDGVSVDHLEGGLYRVQSWVDSQNSFGAMLRTHYVAEVRTSDGKSWKLVSLVTEP